MATIDEKVLEKYTSLNEFREIQFDMLDRFYQFVKRHNLCIFVAWGVYLGYIRENRMIEWDSDIDLAIIEENIDKFLDKSVLETLDEYGFEVPDFTTTKNKYFNDDFQGDYYIIHNKNKKSNQEKIEVFPLFPDASGNKVGYKFWWKTKFTEKKYYEKLIWVNFNNVDMIIPDLTYANNILIHQYDKKWRTPKKSKKYLDIDSKYKQLIEKRLYDIGVDRNEFFEL